MQFHAARNQAMQFCAARNQTNQWRHRNETVTESAQNGTTAYVSECRVDNTRYFVTTMIDNVLQWLCHSCKEQNKETTQSEMPITWGKTKDLKKYRKSLDSA